MTANVQLSLNSDMTAENMAHTNDSAISCNTDDNYRPTWTLQLNACREEICCQIAVQYSDIILLQTTPETSKINKTYL